MSRVVVVMPAYRAAKTLEKTVAEIPPGVADELILVDDASPDDTAEVARQMGIPVHVHPENRGYGGNQKTCYSEALADDADVVVLLHPDYQYDPKAVPLLIAPILAGHADMTFGSRFASQGDPVGGGMPLYRYFGNRITTTIENLMVGSRFTDMHSGLRAYTREFLLSMPFLNYADDFRFDSMMLLDALTSGKKVVEVPIITRYTEESSSISISRSLQYVSHAVQYSTRVAAQRGRRGSRSPVAYTEPKRGAMIKDGPPVTQTCVLCGKDQMVLLYPANAEGELDPSEFSCTSNVVAFHDDIVQCRSCGMVSSTPTVENEEIIDSYEQVVDEDYLTEEEGRRELFTWVLERVGGYYRPGKKLLEIGSNVGLFLDVATKLGWDASGIEPSKWAVETGRERFGVELNQGTIEELDVPDGSVDVVASLDVLEHIANPLEALRKIRPMLNEDGLLVLATVDLSSLHAKLRKGEWPWFIRPHLHYFTPETLHAHLHVAGFDMLEWQVVPRSFKLSYIAQRGGENLGALGKAIAAASKVADPQVPVGWLGDIVLVVAQPRRDTASTDDTVAIAANRLKK